MFKILLMLNLFISPLTTVYNPLPKGKRVEKAGTYFYPFTYTDENGVVSETQQQATIIFPYSVLNFELREGIDAKDIHTNIKNVDFLSHDELIKLARAHAWSMNDGSTIPIEKVELTKENTKPGSSWKATFSTNKNTSISVDVYISENEVIESKDKYININGVRTFNPRDLFWLLVIILLLPLIIYTISFRFVETKYRDTIDLLLKKEDIPEEVEEK